MDKRKIIISAIVTLLMIAVSAFAYTKLSSKKESTVSEQKQEAIIRSVDVKQFELGEIASTIEVDGRISAFEKINVAAEVTGKLLAGNKFREGTYFKKGDLLFQIESSDEQYSLFAQRSSLLNAITQMMPDLKFDYPQSFQNWKNYLDAFDLERPVKALPAIQNDQEKYFIAGKNIFNIFYSIKSMEDRMGNFNIYAPFSGVFLSVNAFPGSLVSPGMNLGQIMNTSRFELVAPMAMENLKYISTGQKIELHASDLGKTWNATVNRVSNQIDQATQSIPVYFDVQGKGLKDGIFVKGVLEGSSIGQACKIPRNLLIDQNHVYVFENGKATKRQVEIVSRIDQMVVVRGISSNDQIISSGVNNLYDGQEVVLRK